MHKYIPAICGAAAIIGIATAGIFDLIDQSAMMTTIIALSAVSWMKSDRRCIRSAAGNA